MKHNQLNELNIEELEIKLQDDLDALQNLRFQKALQQLENPHRIRYLRREIAQIKTVIHENNKGIRHAVIPGENKK
ncbi:MAG: 50S ribosomal protein L29 [Candidatus Neomarinimicrobiota bacterium]